jgi:hypothetical protein
LYLARERAPVDKHGALGVMERRPVGDVVRADPSYFVVDDEILGVQGAGLLPLVHVDAMFKEPTEVVAPLPVHPPQKSVAIRLRDERR